MVTEMELFTSGTHFSLDFCLWVWKKSEDYKRRWTGDELLACILDAAARINKREDQLRRTIRDLCTRVAKCIEVDGGIYEELLCNVINLSFLYNVLVS
jgi:hypothetical protein